MYLISQGTVVKDKERGAHIRHVDESAKRRALQKQFESNDAQSPCIYSSISSAVFLSSLERDHHLWGSIGGCESHSGLLTYCCGKPEVDENPCVGAGLPHDVPRL